MTSKSHSQVAGSETPPLDIGRRLELFVDRYLVDRLDGAAFRMHAPRKEPLPAKPLTGGYMTVIKDGKLFRAYYRRYKPGFKGEISDGNKGECTCYAESRDGIDWDEPDLGLLEDDVFGNLRNGIFDQSPFAHNLSPFLDTRSDVPRSERFKALGGTRGSGLHAFASEDGFHWRHMSDGPAIPHDPELHGPNAFDSQNVAFWSEAEDGYVAYFRHWNSAVGGPRSITRAVSKDFRTWHDESATFRPPNLPGEELYTNQTHPYFRAPHIYIALPTRFTHAAVKGEAVTDEKGNRLNKGSTDILLMTTRPGRNSFERLFAEAFIRPGLDPAGWENRANYLALNVVPTGPGEMSVYNRTGHRYVLRSDGFVSVNAPAAGGELVTKPLVFAGNELVLNLSTSIRGGLRVELQNATGQALPGFEIDSCMPIIDDCIERVVTWRDTPSLAQHAGRPVRLRFTMADSDLYALRFR